MNVKQFIADLHKKHKKLNLSDCKGKTEAAKFLKASIATLEKANLKPNPFDTQNIANVTYEKSKFNIPKFTPRRYSKP